MPVILTVQLKAVRLAVLAAVAAVALLAMMIGSVYATCPLDYRLDSGSTTSVSTWESGTDHTVTL